MDRIVVFFNGEELPSGMTDKVAQKGSGRFQWSAGGWFGSQIGSTFWLLLLGILLVPRSPGPAVIVLGCFLLPNVIGLVIWSRRDHLAPYPAIQSFIAIVGVASLVAFVCWDRSGYLAEASRQVQGSRSPYWILLIFPAVMVMFHFMNRGKQGEGHDSK